MYCIMTNQMDHGRGHPKLVLYRRTKMCVSVLSLFYLLNGLHGATSSLDPPDKLVSATSRLLPLTGMHPFFYLARYDLLLPNPVAQSRKSLRSLVRSF